MPNLLPALQKEQLKKEYYTRVAVVALLLSLFAIVGSVILLLPAYLSVSAKEKAIQEEIAAVQKQIAAEEGEEILSLLGEVRGSVAVLMPTATSSSATKLLQFISEKRPSGVVLTGFSYDHREGGSSLSLIGRALTRDALITFVKELRSDTRFSLVDLPISDLVRSQNLTFTIKIGGSF